MSNRSCSFLKRFKTEKTQKTERNHLLGWRPSNKTPTSRVQNTSRSPAHKEHCEKIQLKERDNYFIKCVNHSLKRASFEPKQSLKQAYCQDCSIKLVKHNVRMLRVTQESLSLRAMYEAQIQKILSYQQGLKQLMERYFEAQRQIVKLSYLKAKQSSEKILTIPEFKIENLSQLDFTLKLKQLVGAIHFKKIEFIYQLNHETQKNRELLKEIELQSYCTSIPNKENQNTDNLPGKWNAELRLKRVWSKEGQKLACLR